MVVEPKDVLLPGTLVLLANFGVLLFWQLASPLEYGFDYLESYDEHGRYARAWTNLLKQSDPSRLPARRL